MVGGKLFRGKEKCIMSNPKKIKTMNTDKIVYTAPDGTTVTQRELDELDQLAAGYCARNNINIFN